MEDKSLIEILEASPKDHSIFEELKELMINTGATKEEISKVLIPYNKSLTSGNGFSKEEVREIIPKLMSLRK